MDKHIDTFRGQEQNGAHVTLVKLCVAKNYDWKRIGFQTVPKTHIILDLLVDLQCLFSGFYSGFFNVPYSVILSVLS